MHIVLGILGVLAFLAGFAILAMAKTSIHEIQGYLLYIVSAVLVAGASIVEAIYASRRKGDEIQKHHFERLAEFLDKKLK
jgi:uncharacterized membrane protein YoaK (UPF0700 family)